MNPFEMVVAIIALVMVASVLKARFRAQHGAGGDEGPTRATAVDAARSAAEIAQLKDRIAVLERLTTDDHGARSLDREIEKLR